MTDRSLIVLFGGRPVAASSYLAALKTARQVANPVLRDQLRWTARLVIGMRINAHLPWWGRGRRWSGGG